MQHEDEEVGLLTLATELLLCLLYILLELAHSILQGCPGVVNLVHNQDVLANQVGHFERAQVQPLCASDLGARNLLCITTTQVLIEGQTDGLDGNVGITRAFQK